MRNKFIRKAALVSAAALIGLGATACSSSSSSSSKSAKTSQTAKKKSKYSFDGKTAKLPGVTVKVDKVRFFNASEITNNKKVVVFEYTITNTGNKSVDVNTGWIEHFNAYQPNKNTDGKLEVATTPMNYESILNNQDQKIKKGGHLNFVCAYELKSDTTPVTLKATDILGEKTYGKHVYKLGTFENQKEV